MSNRLTFSLASLTLIFALVFAAMPVLAHEDTADPAHEHPVIAIAEPTDADDRVAGLQATDSDADTEDHQVVYTVTFPDTPVADDVPVAADFTLALKTTDLLPAPTDMSAVVGTIARVNNMVYTVPVTVTFLDVSDPPVTTDLNEIILDFSYNAGAFTSIRLEPHSTAGQTNEQTDAIEVTVLRDPPDRVAPVLTPTLGADPSGGDAITVTLAFDEAIQGMPTVTHDVTPATLADTYEVSAVAGSGMSFTVTVTPDAATADTGDLVAGTVTLTVSAMDAAGNALAADNDTVDVDLAERTFTDTVAPEVVITPNPDRQSEAFDISFTATDNYSEAADLTVAVAITPATAVTEAAPTAMAQADGSYTVTVTPVAATETTTPIDPVTIRVTVTVTDAGDNPGSDIGFFFLAKREFKDESAPNLDVTIATPDTGTDPPTGTDPLTVTLAFDETFTTAPTVKDSTPATSPIAGTYTVSEVTGSGMSFTVTVTPDALVVGDSDLPGGTVTLTVSGTDDDDNPIAAGTTVEVELAARTAPTDTDAPTFEHDAPTEPISGMTVVTLTFSETVSGVGVTGAPSMDDAKYTAVVAGSGTAYTVTITPISRDNLAADMDLRLITFDVSGADASDNPVDGSFSLSLAARKVAPPTPPDPPAPADPPTFADATVSVPALTVGTAISMGTGTAAKSYISLPLATGGTGDLKYTLWVGLKDITTSGYNGLSLDDVNVGLKGTPLAEDLTGTVFEWRATDAMNLSAKVTFTVVVNPKPKDPDPDPDPTVIVVAPKSTNLDRIGIAPSEFTIAPDQGAFELTVTHKDPRNLIGIWLSGRDYDRNNISFVQNTGTPTSWTLRVAVSNPSPVRSFNIDVFVRNSTLYQLATPSLDDPTKNVNIGGFRVTVDNEGPRVLDIREYQLIPAGGGPFEVSILFNELLKAAPVAGNFTITNGSISEIRLLSAADQYGRPSYLARITPAHGVGPTAAVGKRNVEIRLNGNLADKYGNMSLATAADAVADKSFAIKKATVAPTPPETPPTIGDITAAYVAGTGLVNGTTTISVGRIAANGFAVIDASGLPDLEYFFDIGGSITLHDNDTVDDKNSRTVVMSEILWGLDLGELDVTKQDKHQFIELYNTTNAEIDLAGWKLTFTEGNVRPAIDIDQVSNRGPDGWEVDTGDTGKSGRVTDTLATDATSTITPVDIVSMYRNIDYDKVEKTDHDADAKKNRDAQLGGIPDGNKSPDPDPNKRSWKNSIRRSANRWILSTPGARHHKTIDLLTASTVGHHKWFRINEIGNDTDGANDWVELHNYTDAERSLKNYSLSMVTAKGTDTRLFHFHDQDWKVPAKGFVVISTRHPRDTDLAAGKDISVADDQEENRGASHLFVVKSGWNLQDDGKFALILRSHHEKQKTDELLEDVIAARSGAFADTNTSLWPLKLGGNPHGNVIDGGDEDFRAGKVYQRNGGTGRGEKQFAVRGSTGVGYDRAAEASAANGGTPGYDNGLIKEKIADLSDAEVSFSEIMLGLGDSRQNLPQWIEIYNGSMTQAVTLGGWKLHVENTADVETALDAVLNLDGMVIPPNQTVLIVTNTGRVSDPDHFPSNRVVNLWTTKKHRDALEMIRRTDQVFSTTGLYLKLTDKDNKLVDEFGNLDGNRRTRDELENTWAIPMNGTDDGRRSSLIRVYDAGVPIKGTMAEAWVLADETNLAFAISETYYGDPDDFGTPGFRAGGPLPVSLSKFRPERLDDGSIRIVWVTESELNNAGFNILRSEKRDSEFKQINTKLIAGKGTTSERSTYTHTDTSAKPNVVYYYQIQDVSLDGKVTTLRLSRLKGHVSAAGKLTTTWGELKALQ